jgi:hypothetical protein
MNHRPLRSAIALSLGALIAFAGAASADSARADGDVTTPAVETVANLLPFAPGEERAVDIGIVLTCAGTTHVDPGQTVTAAIDSWIAPLDGAIVSVTDGTVGPAPADWTPDGVSCPLPARMFYTGTPSVVTVRAPTTPGTGYLYSLMYHRSIEPFGANDAGAVRQLTAIDIKLDVVVPPTNTPPTLTLPTLAGAGTVEGNRIGGWWGPWLGLGATDLEDDPDPTATCNPAPGDVLPLGPTAVTCSATDSGGLSTTESFNLTVVDTTAPTFVGLSGDQTVPTADPTGTTLVYSTPGAVDIVDSHLTVGCLPASGTPIGLGTTTVSCTATDDSGNTAHGSFAYTVVFVPPHTASATWGEPVAGNGTTLVANRGRNIPIKVELFLDGASLTGGAPELAVSPCATGSGVRIALVRGNGRWNAALDTSVLDGSCYTVTATIDGFAAGSFRLDLRGAEPVKNSKPTTTTINAAPVAKPAPAPTAKPTPSPKATPAPTTKSTKTKDGKK